MAEGILLTSKVYTTYIVLWVITISRLCFSHSDMICSPLQNLLRKSLYYNYDHYHAMGKGPFANSDDIVRYHVCMFSLPENPHPPTFYLLAFPSTSAPSNHSQANCVFLPLNSALPRYHSPTANVYGRYWRPRASLVGERRSPGVP